MCAMCHVPAGDSTSQIDLIEDRDYDQVHFHLYLLHLGPFYARREMSASQLFASES